MLVKWIWNFAYIFSAHVIKVIGLLNWFVEFLISLNNKIIPSIFNDLSSLSLFMQFILFVYNGPNFNLNMILNLKRGNDEKNNY